MSTEINDRMEIRTTKISGANEWATANMPMVPTEKKNCNVSAAPTTTIHDELVDTEGLLSEAYEVSYAILRFLAGDDNVPAAIPINNVDSLLQNSISVKEKSSYLCGVIHEIAKCIGLC